MGDKRRKPRAKRAIASKSTHHEEFARQVTAIVDATVHDYELIHSGLILDARIVQGRVQHDDGEAEHVTGVRVGEYVRVQLAVPLREAFHHTVFFLLEDVEDIEKKSSLEITRSARADCSETEAVLFYGEPTLITECLISKTSDFDQSLPTSDTPISITNFFPKPITHPAPPKQLASPSSTTNLRLEQTKQNLESGITFNSYIRSTISSTVIQDKKKKKQLKETREQAFISYQDEQAWNITGRFYNQYEKEMSVYTLSHPMRKKEHRDQTEIDSLALALLRRLTNDLVTTRFRFIGRLLAQISRPKNTVESGFIRDLLLKEQKRKEDISCQYRTLVNFVFKHYKTTMYYYSSIAILYYSSNTTHVIMVVLYSIFYSTVVSSFNCELFNLTLNNHREDPTYNDKSMERSFPSNRSAVFVLSATMYLNETHVATKLVQCGSTVQIEPKRAEFSRWNSLVVSSAIVVETIIQLYHFHPSSSALINDM
ncbi:hypothetical protein WN51_07715 [Melipona quadrifasciata]|uniref:Uncharacterized protein n=1 Tax=Melipona quadrifasciata TaxID=166423 RepID=A0A0M9A8Z0_9HYME|nr:hypothetical protein WN51_07715 [Melipona quadrifasciata]